MNSCFRLRFLGSGETSECAASAEQFFGTKSYVAIEHPGDELPRSLPSQIFSGYCGRMYETTSRGWSLIKPSDPTAKRCDVFLRMTGSDQLAQEDWLILENATLSSNAREEVLNHLPVDGPPPLIA